MRSKALKMRSEAFGSVRMRSGDFAENRAQKYGILGFQKATEASGIIAIYLRARPTCLQAVHLSIR